MAEASRASSFRNTANADRRPKSAKPAIRRRPCSARPLSARPYKFENVQIAFGRRKVEPKKPGANLQDWDGEITGGVVDKRTLTAGFDVEPESRQLYSSGCVSMPAHHKQFACNVLPRPRYFECPNRMKSVVIQNSITQSSESQPCVVGPKPEETKKKRVGQV